VGEVVAFQKKENSPGRGLELCYGGDPPPPPYIYNTMLVLVIQQTL